MNKIEPMLCKKGEKDILFSDEYLFQPKLDGTRAIFQDETLYNRRGRNIKYRYPEFESFQITEDSIVDGEVVVYNKKGIPDFHQLQSREQTSNKMKIEILSQKYPATYIVFDCLKYKGKDLMDKPVEKRLDYLKKAVREGEHLEIIFTTKNGESLWKKMIEMDLEGVMAKKKGSRYYPGKRSAVCIKIKNLQTVDCVIMGYTQGEGKRKETFGALVIGLYNEEDELINIGKVGTGWTDRELELLKEKMDKIKVEERENRVLIKPELVCEVEYLEVTSNKELRAPSYKGLRKDKKPKECRLENIL